jgi:hypothetical protein
MATLTLAVAAAAGPANDAIIQRLRRIHPLAEQYSVTAGPGGGKAGAARVYVKAPIDTAIAIVTDYGNYRAMIRRFERAEVVGKHGDQTDVALRVPILNGRSRVNGTLRFDPPRREGDEVVVVGRMIDGNVRRFDATFRLRKIDDESTQLNLEMVIEPKLPVPTALVTRETADASDGTVRRLRDFSERRFRASKGR